VSIKYRVNVYSPDGKLADSWGFTGYGTSPAGGLSNTEPLQNATALAMRDAGAKLAVEFRDQAIVRGLLPESETADAPATQQPSSDPPPASEGLAAPESPTAPEQGESESPPEAAPTEDSEIKPEEEAGPELPEVEAFAAANGNNRSF
jgi:hypothetical protein